MSRRAREPRKPGGWWPTGTTPLPGESEDVSAGPAGPGRCTQGARQPLTLRTRRRVSLDTRGAEESPPGAWASCKNGLTTRPHAAEVAWSGEHSERALPGTPPARLGRARLSAAPRPSPLQAPSPLRTRSHVPLSLCPRDTGLSTVITRDGFAKDPAAEVPRHQDGAHGWTERSRQRPQHEADVRPERGGRGAVPRTSVPRPRGPWWALAHGRPLCSPTDPMRGLFQRGYRHQPTWSIP